MTFATVVTQVAAELAPFSAVGFLLFAINDLLAPLDRLQMSSWALLRGAPAPGALASGGTLSGSQAGARLTYAFNRQVAASIRSTSPIGGSTGAEIAGVE